MPQKIFEDETDAQDSVEGSGHVPPLKRCTDFGSEYQVEVLPPVARFLFEFLLVLPLDVEYFLQLRCEGDGSASCFCFRGTDLQGGSAGIVLVKVAVPADRLDDGEVFAMDVTPAEAGEFCKADSCSKHEVQGSSRSVIRERIRALDMLPDDRTYFTDFEPDNRVTLIAPDGSVLYDSDADEARMDSHAQRPEVLAALADGTGESTRYSDTLSEVTIYYARRTADGNVLRIASTRSSVLGVFVNVAPQIIISLLMVAALSLLIARFASRQIVQPINDLNLDEPLENSVYDELAPLLTRMDRQRGQIRQQVRDLARAHADFNAIMANMREGLVLLSKEIRIISINCSAQRIFGVKGVIAPDADLLTICRDAAVLEIVKAAQKGECGDVVLSRDNRTYRIFASPVLREDKVRGVVLLAQDISARYAAEASRREFTANVSHELKTPLTSISGYAEIIESGIAKTEDVPAFAWKIRAEAKRLVALVNDILELSRLDEKQGLGAKEHINLLPVLNGLADSFVPIAAEKGVTLSVEGCDATVEGYRCCCGNCSTT